jgi:hypothetical protein
MPASHLDRIADPLRERFYLKDLPAIAPWVAEEIDFAGVDDVRRIVAELGYDPAAPQLMMTWVSALSRLRGAVWDAA